MSKSTTRAIAFDFDGTLVDSAPGILSGMALTLEKNQIQPAVPLNTGIIGPPLRTTLALISGHQNDALLDQLVADFKLCYDSNGYRATKPYPGIGEALAQLKEQGYALYLATNKRGTPTRLILDYLDWTPLFSAVYALDEHLDCTDKKQILEKMLADHHLPASNTPYVGDTDTDATAARHNGMPYIHVAWGYGDNPLQGSICHDSTELVSLLNRAPWI
ncbi:MAG TPA: HAD hydrolase-like protein [Rhodocyclaceae bacterium]|jgi:phosphoglycolate phosphatase